MVLMPYKSTRTHLPSIQVSDSGSITENFVTGGWIWPQGRNRVFTSSLSYSTITSTVLTAISSIQIIPLFSGHIFCEAEGRANNNSVNQGVAMGIYLNGTALIHEVYQSEPVAGNEQPFTIPVDVTGKAINSTQVFSLRLGVVGSGAAIGRTIALWAEEL